MKIVIGGMVEQDTIFELVKKIAGPNAEVTKKNDIEAAMDVKNGVADYYLGACHTGGGGALAMAIAIVGMNKCVTVSMPGKILNDEDIAKEVNNGKRAFGFTAQHMDQVVPAILKAIMANS